METRTFTITASAVLLRRIERFLALLHYNSGFGHSGLFAMPLDGDGNEKVKVDGLDRRLAFEVDALGGVGYDVEIARDDSYSGRFLDRKRPARWYTGPAANLYKDGEIAKTIPSRDHDAVTPNDEAHRRDAAGGPSGGADCSAAAGQEKGD